MDLNVQEKDFELLDPDRCTFNVLSRILRGPCDLVVTDHARFLLCHSDAPHPVWVWTPDDTSEAEKEKAFRTVQEHRPFEKGFRYNLKYELAEYFIKKAQSGKLSLRISTNLLAYECPCPAAPANETDGTLYLCREEDAAEAADLMAGFYTEVGESMPPYEQRLETAKARIAENACVFWKNGEGKTVACCYYRINDGLGCLSGVYTVPAFRRHHYAQHMVYAVTCRIKEMGLTPMLYTDADYPASNACYTKIGYIKRGSLCTMTAQR